ncbi:MAG: ferredoxin reductase family protein [Micrococcales bacterium]|nr:ferredoxin reductase family protein [Micrococcales bacterium]
MSTVPALQRSSTSVTAPIPVPAAAGEHTAYRPDRRRTPRRTPGWWRDAGIVAFWGINLVVTALWVKGGGLQDLTAGTGAALTSLGRITAMISSALLLVQVFLMARVPLVERAWGPDGLVRLHRYVGFTSFNLMLAHILLITLGYAAGSPNGLWGTIVELVVDYPGMLLAVAGTLALCMVVVTSVRKARARLRYESWHLIHLYGYLGAGLALPHQLWTGQEFLDSTAATWFWWTAYAVTAAAVLVYRLGVPAWRSLRSPIRVVDVRAEGPDATTVTVSGKEIGDWGTQAGQFFQWRFLDGPGWTRAHPYSISAAPTADTLRFTAAHLGDGSAALAHLRPGTRVLLEGPYGRLHPGVRTQPRVLLWGAGIGITPMRAILEELDAAPGDVTVIHRTSTPDGAVLVEELSSLAKSRDARYFLVSGHRRPGAATWLPASAGERTDVDALRELVPDIADHDVYLCGAPAWMDAARDAALAAGVPATRIHLERFAY